MEKGINKKKKILILCTGNSCRSQMAEGFFKKYKKDWIVESAGITPIGLNPLVVEVMAEKGIDMLDAPVSGAPPKAAEGTLSIMVGGKKEIFKQCLPILEVMGEKEKIIHAGYVGMGANLVGFFLIRSSDLWSEFFIQ